MKNLKGMFWTNKDELVEDVRKLGYEVYEINDEYMVVAPVDSEDEEEQETIYLNVVRNTITLA